MTGTFAVREVEDDGGFVDAQSLDARQRKFLLNVKFDGPPLLVRTVLTPLGKSFQPMLACLEKDPVHANVRVGLFGGGLGGRTEKRKVGGLVEIQDLLLVIVEQVRDDHASLRNGKKASGGQGLEDDEGIGTVSSSFHVVVRIQAPAVARGEFLDELVDTFLIDQTVGVGSGVINLPVRLKVGAVKSHSADIGFHEVGVDVFLELQVFLDGAGLIV